MLIVQMTQDSIEEFQKFEWRLIIELHETEVAHEWRSVESVDNLLDFRSREGWCLLEHLGLCVVREETAALWRNGEKIRTYLGWPGHSY